MFTKIGRQSLRYCKSCSRELSQSGSPKVNNQIEFNQFRNQWWDEAGCLKPLHSLNKLRVPFVRDGLINTGLVKNDFINTPRPLTNVQILEVGCGGGILTEALARLGSSVTGIDTASDLLEEAKEHSKKNLLDINYSLATIEKFSEKNSNKFDAVVASEVLEHINDKDAFVEACIKCLKPNGSFFVTTINQTFLAWLCALFLAENILRIVPQGTHHYNSLVPVAKLQKELEHSNCRIRVIHGMCYNVLTNNWSWTTDTSINYALQAIKN